jgi:hypothetical protein
MKILTHKDLILGFIKQNLVDKEHQKQIHQILDNENSVFLFSKKFFSFIKEELGEEYQHEYERLLTKFSDFGYSIASSPNSQNFDDEILHILAATQDRVVISIACNQPSREVQNSISNIAVLSQQQKPNYHWLVVKLAILHPNKVTVNCFDFQTNGEIKAFFDGIFSIPKQITIVNIFDRQTTDFNHNRFDSIRTTKSIKYFTFAHKYIIQDIDTIKGFFNRVKIFTTRTKNITHGRRVLFENLVLISDNDFNNLNVGEDWNIDIQYSEKDFQNWLSRLDKYRDG